MNKNRRKELGELQAKLSEVKTSLECILHEEESAFDNLPEVLQESEKGERMQEIIEAISDALDNLEEAEENLGNAIVE